MNPAASPSPLVRQKLVNDLARAVLTTLGATSEEVRRAVRDRVRRRALERTGRHNGESTSPAHETEPLSEEMKAYVDAVAEHAHDVTDAQVQALLKGGLSEEAVFELTVVAAVARGIFQLERGLAALEAGN